MEKIQKHRKCPALLRTQATSNWEIICCPATLRWSGVECGAARSHGKTWQLKISDSLQGCHLAVSDESFSVMFRREITLGKDILVLLLTLACWKETLDIANWIIYTTDYRTSSLNKK